MKKFIRVALAGSLFFPGACHKPATGPEQAALIAISGSWELRQSTGGFAGTINYQPGNSNIVQFKNDFTYTFSANNFSRQGQYQITPTLRAGDWWLLLQYNANNQPVSEKDSIRLEPGRLIFLPSASCCDLATILYERVH